MSEPQTVEIASAGERLSALLYLPDGPGPHPAVVLGGGWCYVKELVQPMYASVFARNGMAALVFDYRYMGASTGEPRQHIDPWQQIEDYRNAISYMESREDVDSERIGAWGISYSGGHVMILGALDPRVRAICGVVPTVDGWQNMRLAHGTLGFRRLQSAIADARRKLYETGEHTYIPHQPESEGDLSVWPFPKSKVTFARLKETQAPAYEGRSTVQSAELLLAYSVMPYVERLVATPTLLVVAEGDDHTHWDLAAAAYAAIPGDRKRWHAVPKSGHLTLYEDEAAVSAVAQVAAEWFSDWL
ncbi:MAG: alpha/beta hydrolase [Thermoleophilaceae bacterium]